MTYNIVPVKLRNVTTFWIFARKISIYNIVWPLFPSTFNPNSSQIKNLCSWHRRCFYVVYVLRIPKRVIWSYFVFFSQLQYFLCYILLYIEFVVCDEKKVKKGRDEWMGKMYGTETTTTEKLQYMLYECLVTEWHVCFYFVWNEQTETE